MSNKSKLDAGSGHERGVDESGSEAGKPNDSGDCGKLRRSVDAEDDDCESGPAGVAFKRRNRVDC